VPVTETNSSPLSRARRADAAALALSLDRDSDIALHTQLGAQLRQMILSARIARGARLPSTRALASDLGVSRTTVILAYEQLASEGYLEGRRGSGIYVPSNLPEQALQVTPSVSNARRQRRVEAPAPPPSRPFQLGAADPSLFPSHEWARLMHRGWRSPRPELILSRDPMGWPALRSAIADHLAEWRDITCSPEQIVITAGAADAMDLIARAAYPPGSAVYTEEPGFPTLRYALHNAGLKPLPVGVDTDGFNLDHALQRGTATGAILTPSRQFPLGMALPLGRRLGLLDWADTSNGYIVEDDFDSEYRYEGAPLPALMSLDRNERVIYIGSFSKVLAPTLRLGFVVVPGRLLGRLRDHLHQRGALASLFLQPMLAEFMVNGDFARHIRRTRRIYARRMQAMMALAPRLHDLLVLNPASAGMHIVADLAPPLRRRMNDREAASRADASGITAAALSQFYAGRATRQGLLLGFAAFGEDAGSRAMDRLAQALRRR
jgi:GntR family transcriptional regulator/MocR family aminotransferase